jgi:hypothetical protein
VLGSKGFFLLNKRLDSEERSVILESLGVREHLSEGNELEDISHYCWGKVSIDG